MMMVQAGHYARAILDQWKHAPAEHHLWKDFLNGGTWGCGGAKPPLVSVLCLLRLVTFILSIQSYTGK